MRYILCAIIIMATLSLNVWANDNESLYKITDVSVEKIKDDIYAVQAQIENLTGKEHKVSVFRLSFFDEQDKLIGYVKFTINNFMPNEKVVVDNRTRKKIINYKTYKLRLDSQS